MLGQLVEQFLKRKRNFWIAEIVIAFIPVVVIAIFSEAVHATGIYKLFGTLDAILFTLVLNLATLITSIEHNVRKDKVKQRRKYRRDALLTLLVYPFWLVVASPHEARC